MDGFMQPVTLTFMALLLAHLLADFPLQSQWIARNKGSRLRALGSHGLIHWVCAWACLLCFAGAHPLSWRAQALVAAYAAAHLLIDKSKCWFTAWTTKDTAAVFSADQALHVLMIGIASLLLTATSPRVLRQIFPLPLSARVHVLEIATVYLAVVVPGGYLIRYLTKNFRSTLDDESESRGRPAGKGLKNAGLYIGYLERFLIVTAIAAQSATLVGLILTGKSIARFPEFKKASFAEYFLVGTLLSISLALVGGLLLQKLLYGAIVFK